MRKLGRKKAHREQLYKNLVTSVILYEKIETTLAKAKEAKSIAEKMITLGKTGTLQARRDLIGYLNDENAVKKIFEVMVDRYKNKNSGFMRIYHLGHRVGDGAPKALLQFIPVKSDVKVSKDKKEDEESEKTADKSDNKKDESLDNTRDKKVKDDTK